MEGIKDINFTFYPLDACMVNFQEQKKIAALQAATFITCQYLAYLESSKSLSSFSPDDLARTVETIHQTLSKQLG